MEVLGTILGVLVGFFISYFFYRRSTKELEKQANRLKLAFKILQLDQNQPRMCYNNTNRTPSDGSVIHFLDGYPNGNYTITPQDSTQITNSELINPLNHGLYNIQKNYLDGSTEQVMILKENE